jgi:hypothetical protein
VSTAVVDRHASPPLCPSAPARLDGAFVFGVVGGTPEERRVGYLNGRVPVTDEVLALAGPVNPAAVFRFAAPCAGSGCSHFDGSDCRLVTKLVQMTPIVSKALPACQVRPDCRWWRQEGKSACMRCPAIVTETAGRPDAERMACDPAF